TFLDMETTGLYPHFGDRVCEVALLRCRGRHELARFQSLVNPRRPVSPGAYAVNRIDDEMVRDAPLFEEVVDQVLALLEGAVIVAHNAPFDLGFLTNELQIARWPPIENLVVDTLALARRYYSFPSNSLDNVAYYLGLMRHNAHRAMGDVETTKQVFESFLHDFRRQGVETLADLLRLQGGSVPFPIPAEVPLPPDIDEALHSGRRLRLRYVSAQGHETRRIVEPLQVTAYGDYQYLVAYCFLRQEQRTFRLDRIVEMHLEGPGLEG
ncbi:MAG: exonuclease domain-containing protein, partial [Anaerolineae bacterium]